jgi:hypothetical protein
MRISGDGDQRFPNDRNRDSWMIMISVPTEGEKVISDSGMIVIT